VCPRYDALLDQIKKLRENARVSVILDLDDEALSRLPLPPGEGERHMQIELACRYYANGWLSLGQAARMAKLDRFTFGAQLADRGIPRQYTSDDLDADLKYAGGQ
jgi:predicted HTH domain antitoxin